MWPSFKNLHPNFAGGGAFSETLILNGVGDEDEQKGHFQIHHAARRTGRLLWSIVAVSVAGALLALFGAYQTLLAQYSGVARLSGCSVNEWISCEKALSSGQALVFGVPVAWAGWLYYLWIGWNGSIAVRRTDKKTERLQAMTIISAAAMGVSLYKAGVLGFVQNVVCPICIGMHIVNTSIWLGMICAVQQNQSDESRQKKGRNHLGPASTPKWKSFLLVAYAGGFILAGMGAAKFVLPLWLGLSAIDVEAEVAKHFAQKPQRLEVHPFAPVWGNANAAVRMVVYSDFQCPHCKRAAFHLRRLLDEFKDDLSLAFMNFPLDRKINPALPHAPHDLAGLAARAAVCAQGHGGFWEFHDRLFEHQDELSLDFILKLAAQQGWDRAAFAQELEAQNTYLRVMAEIQYAARVQIRSTPAVIINGRPLQYWEHPEILRRVVRNEIERSKS